MRRLGRAVSWFGTLLLTVCAFAPTEIASASVQNWHSIAYWQPSSGTDYGGVYTADIPSVTVNCSPATKGLVNKAMWLPHSGTNNKWVEFGWFSGLGLDGSCYTSVFYTGWIASDGAYHEYHSQSGGDLTVGHWNTFSLVYYGLIGGIPYYRASLNGSNFLTVAGGAPFGSKLQIGMETDDQATCLNNATFATEWKTYNYSTGTFSYPSSASTTVDGAWLAAPSWTAPYHDMKWAAGCGGV